MARAYFMFWIPPDNIQYAYARLNNAKNALYCGNMHGKDFIDIFAISVQQTLGVGY